MNYSKQEQNQFKKLELLGTTEVAEVLGWKASKVATYNLRGKLPDPIGFVGGRPVWTKRAIDSYKNQN